MRNNDEIEKDIAVFLNQEDSMGLDDKRNLLRALFAKHFVLQDSDLILNRFDFNQIRCAAVKDYSGSSLPTELGTQKLDHNETRDVVLMEAFVGFLNSKGVLKRTPKFERGKK